MKLNELTLHSAADGTEYIIGYHGAPGSEQSVRMPPAVFAAAGTRPTAAELAAAILDTLVQGSNITVTDNGDGTATVAVKNSPALTGTPTAPTAAMATDNDQIATTAFVHDLYDVLAATVATKQAALTAGANITITPNGDGTFEIASTASGGGLADGDHGEVSVSGGNFTLQPTEEAYGAGWNGDGGAPTKNALYAKLEAVVASIGGRVSTASVGAANGVAPLDATGKVPAANLPSYVDDVLEFSNTGTFPAVGETGKIYVALDTNKQHRWSGSAYQALTASPGTTDAVPEGATNLYYTDVRVRAAVMTGLVDTTGTPAATDSVLAILGKLKRQAFTRLPLDYAALANASNVFSGALSAQTPNSAQSGGYVLRGNATSGYAYFQATNTDASAQWGYLRWSVGGECYVSGALQVQGDITYLSDRRIKSDIRPFEGAALALTLDAKRFIKNDRESIGFIAQEVEAVIPEAVRETADGFKSLDLTPIVAALVEQVKLQAARIEALEARLA